jgi:integrase/recombinase XerD
MPRKGTHTPRDPLGDPNDPQGWHVLTEAFCEWMGIQNYSPRTIHGRRTYLKYFALWAIERGLTRPDEITKPILERYQRHLFHHRKTTGEPMSVRGQHARLIPVCPATIKTDPRRQLELTPDRVVLRGGRGALRHAV